MKTVTGSVTMRAENGDRLIEPLADVEVGPAAALPKADIHLHSEAGPRLEQLMAEWSGERVTDWLSAPASPSITT